MTRNIRRVVVCLGLVLMAASLSGCIVEDGHCGGWWHHCR